MTVLLNASVSRTNTFTRLGVDEKLSWEKHIEKICSKVSAGIGARRCIKPYVPPATLQTIYKTLVQPYFDYCSPLCDNCGKELQDKLQKFQKRAEMFDTLGWETLNVRRLRNRSILMYKILNDHTAPNLKDYCAKQMSVRIHIVFEITKQI